MKFNVIKVLTGIKIMEMVDIATNIGNFDDYNSGEDPDDSRY